MKRNWKQAMAGLVAVATVLWGGAVPVWAYWAQIHLQPQEIRPAPLGTTVRHNVKVVYEKETLRFKQNGKWGILQADGQVLLPPDLKEMRDTLIPHPILEQRDLEKLPERVEAYEKDRVYMEDQGFLETRNHSLRIYTKTGNLVAGPYAKRSFWREDKLVCNFEGKYGAFDKQGHNLTGYNYDRMADYCQGLARVEKKKLWGFVNAAGQEVVSCQYAEAGDFGDGLAPVKTKSGWGYIDVSGTMVIPAGFQKAETFRAGLAPVKTDKGWGVINTQGDMVVPAHFEKLYLEGGSLFSEGFMGVKTKNGWGFINQEGKLAVPDHLKKIETPFQEGLAGVETERDGRAYIDNTGKVRFQIEASKLFPFQKGLAEFQRKTGSVNGLELFGALVGLSTGGLYYQVDLMDSQMKRGYVDKNGTIVISGKLDKVFPMTDYGVEVVDKGLHGFLDRTGKTIIPAQYQSLGAYFDNAYVIAQDKEGRFGLLNGHTGQKLLGFSYEQLRFVSPERLAYRLNERWGLFNLQGDRISRPVYDEIGQYSEGWAAVRIGNEWKYIDDQGNIAPIQLPAGIQGLGDFRKGVAPVRIDKNWGLLDKTGNWIMQPQYQELQWL